MRRMCMCEWTILSSSVDVVGLIRIAICSIFALSLTHRHAFFTRNACVRVSFMRLIVLNVYSVKLLSFWAAPATDEKFENFHAFMHKKQCHTEY